MTDERMTRKQRKKMAQERSQRWRDYRDRRSRGDIDTIEEAQRLDDYLDSVARQSVLPDAQRELVAL